MARSVSESLAKSLGGSASAPNDGKDLLGGEGQISSSDKREQLQLDMEGCPTRSARRGLGNPRYSRLGSRRYEDDPGGNKPGAATIERDSEPSKVLLHAAWHSVGWLFAANLIGVWLAVCLLYPSAGAWLRDWSYGRWMPVHLNFQLYGWMALPLVAWTMRIDHTAIQPQSAW